MSWIRIVAVPDLFSPYLKYRIHGHYFSTYLSRKQFYFLANENVQHRSYSDVPAERLCRIEVQLLVNALTTINQNLSPSSFFQIKRFLTICLQGRHSWWVQSNLVHMTAYFSYLHFIFNCQIRRAHAHLTNVNLLLFHFSFICFRTRGFYLL